MPGCDSRHRPARHTGTHCYRSPNRDCAAARRSDWATVRGCGNNGMVGRILGWWGKGRELVPSQNGPDQGSRDIPTVPQNLARCPQFGMSGDCGKAAKRCGKPALAAGHNGYIRMGFGTGFLLSFVVISCYFSQVRVHKP